jgi:hypothetical protein
LAPRAMMKAPATGQRSTVAMTESEYGIASLLSPQSNLSHGFPHCLVRAMATR